MNLLLLLACGGGSVTSPAPKVQPTNLPAHPADIPVEPLVFDVPDPASFRGEHAGVPVYVAESHSLPVVHVDLTFRGGTWLEPEGHAGLGAFTGELMRSGGTKSLAPRDLDDALDRLAADVDVNVGDELSTVRATCLVRTLDDCVRLTFEIARSPRFDPERFRLAIDGWRAAIERKNDDASSILNRTWDKLLWGEDHYLGTDPDLSDVAAVSIEDARALHGRIFHPGNLVVAVSGDTDRATVDRLLDRELQGWAAGPPAGMPPAPTLVPKPGVYHVQKDIPQGKVRFGSRGLKRDDPDAVAMDVMNFILGGGGFVSRITGRVRTDEGLAYSARSGLFPEVVFPGSIRVWTESKSETVALATKIMWEEVERIRTEPVSDKELQTAKASLRAEFPRMFESRQAMLAEFVESELTGRPADWWPTYLDRLDAVTAADVQRVASTHLKPESFVLLVVGDWEPIAKGDLGGRATMQAFYDGAVTHLDP